MTSSIRPILLSALALAGIVALAGTAMPSPAAAASGGVPPFCILRGSVEGPGGSPQDCRYDDWQACLQAAAVQRGNCVQNIDYHGPAASTTAAAPGRERRRR